uniref:Serrate RNA effector molecule homolog isoform X8 n=1 Tax=Geotrypetes seraphini TaxID=260995 RepID=A0A6P8NVN1_GEOSA|nr:serrate RNA effector molecule homolog isoform X8 [Geotrypetes seraphini]
MGDSDDEYDRRRRDKFRRERSDYDRSREREDRRRDDWNDREWDRGRERRSRAEYRDYDRSRRERFSPPRHELSPPQKRLRRDWLGNLHEIDMGTPPPVMKSFKEFLLSLDDSVDETEAVKRYNDYKLDFRRQQMQDFFLAHKEEEWFRSRYHPDEVGKRKQEVHSALRNRLGVYMYLMDNNWFDTLTLDIEKANAIVKLFDAAVIKMEGGTEHDMKILDMEEEEEKQEKAEAGKKEEARPPDAEKKAPEKEEKEENKENKKAESEEPAEEKPKKAEEEEEKKTAPKEEPEKEPKKQANKKKKRKRSGDDSEDEGSASESESESESGKPADEKESAGDSKEKKEEEKPKEKPDEVKPRPLHRTCSLFMRNIAPNISRAEIIALCKRYPGFMRVALSDPQPDRRFSRRAWVTYDRSVNIKEICWNLQNIRLRDCELSPGVNRDLTRRVRHVNGITQHKQIVRNDIKLAAKLIHTLDDRTKIWNTTGEEEAIKDGANPLLKNITDYLIEEVNAEEEELLGNSGEAPDEPPKEGNPAEINVERDEKLIKVVDKLLLYLRVVHSIDYYSTCEYPNEDAMPNRCGIMHVRGPMPPNRISHGEVAEWQKTFEERLNPLFSVRESLSEEEAQKMGRKDPEQEVEKFVTANTQELGKDKWLCPLSGKKFKGPEFVRKHIFNKHSDKIEEVKKEVAFFNNFLMDAKRPSLPELIKPNQPPVPGQISLAGLTPGILYPNQNPQALLSFGQPRPPILPYGAGPAYAPAPYAAGRGNYDSFRGQGGYPGKPRNRMIRGDPRALIEYRDLDAPEDVDFF